MSLSSTRARSAMSEICWTAIVGGPLAQCALIRSEVSEDDIPVFAKGDGDLLEGSSISVEGEIRLMHTFCAHVSGWHAKKLQAARTHCRLSWEPLYVSRVTSAM